MRLLLLLQLLLSGILCTAQNSFYAETRIYSGFVTPHRVGMESLANKPILGAELNLLHRSTQDNYYDNFYNYPYKGFGISYDNLGYKDVLGEAYSVYSFMDFTLKDRDFCSFHTRVSMGLSYLTKRFHIAENPDNVAVSTPINFYFNLNFDWKYKPVGSNFIFGLGTGLIHYSNGAVIKPNKGLNQIIFTGSLAYDISDNYKQKPELGNVKPVYKKWEIWALATLNTSDEYAYKDVGRGGGFLSSTMSIGVNKRYSPTAKYGIAADVFYEENFYWYYDTKWDTLVKLKDNPMEILRCGISFGHELIYKNLSFISYAGVYYYKKIKPNEWFYTRLGLKYYPIDNLFINLSLKAFGFKAHYIESGIGFSLYK
jgi:hypothetical protein